MKEHIALPVFSLLKLIRQIYTHAPPGVSRLTIKHPAWNVSSVSQQYDSSNNGAVDMQTDTEHSR